MTASMPRQSLDILTVNTSDLGGGAERIAWDLFRGFRRRGHRSRFVVGQKNLPDEDIVPIHSSPYLDYGSFVNPSYEKKHRRQRWLTTRLGLENFAYPYSEHLLEMSGLRPDLVHFHNMHGGYIDLRVLASLSQHIPVFLTLHDCWTFTGHCAHPFDCTKWQTGCGRCPYLSTPPAIQRDATRWNWRRKRKTYQASRLFVAAPSNWLMERARNSILEPAMAGSRMIYNGVDLNVFKPGDKAHVREELGIPADSHTVMFAAQSATTNPFKNYPVMLSAIRLLGQHSAKPVHLLVVGAAGAAVAEEHMPGVVVRNIAFESSPDKMAKWYQAADVYLHVVKAEVFSLSSMEAMACGTPVVASAVGGLREIILDRETGLLVSSDKPEDYCDAVEELLTDEMRRRQMGALAARRAHQHFGTDRMLDDYLNWFVEGIEAFSRPG